MIDTQKGTIALGIIGILLASRIPVDVLTALTPQHAQNLDNVAQNTVHTGMTRAIAYIGPWSRIIGAGMSAVSIIALLVQWRDSTYRSTVSNFGLNILIAIGIGMGAAACIIKDPPHVDIPTDQITTTGTAIKDGVSGPVSWDSRPRKTQP